MTLLIHHIVYILWFLPWYEYQFRSRTDSRPSKRKHDNDVGLRTNSPDVRKGVVDDIEGTDGNRQDVTVLNHSKSYSFTVFQSKRRCHDGSSLCHEVSIRMVIVLLRPGSGHYVEFEIY